MGSHSPLNSSSSSHGVASLQFDPQQPFKRVVVCCTSIPPDERSEVDKRVVQLGGCHKYDLTPEVTHLVVGDYDTPKYRHVAKERPDVVPVAAGWIQAVMDLWKQDGHIDFAALENTWRLKPLESSGGPLLVSSSDGAPRERGKLIVCLTGFDDPDQRQTLITTINENGGVYTGDLTRKVTHLIVRKPEGRKYIAARHWGLKCVASKWLQDSLSRGMILSEDCYDPLLPPDKLGEGAWTRKHVEKAVLGKRLRDSSAVPNEDGVRKLRKTASMKLQSQSQDMWASILGASTPADPPITISRSDAPSQTGSSGPTQPNPRSMKTTQPPRPAKEDVPVFSTCVVYVHGYNDSHHAIVTNVIRGLGGRLCSSLDEATTIQSPDVTHRFLVVPQNSQPQTHPSLPDGFHIVTEFYLEKCLHKKTFFDPSEHVLGRPFPVFPISNFTPLRIAIGGFTDVDLQQVEKAITQLGATFAERFTSKAHILVCNDLSAVREKKINLALSWQVPVVSAEWLWDCIQIGSRIPLKKYLISQLHQRVVTELPQPHTNDDSSTVPSRSLSGNLIAKADGVKERISLQRTVSDPVARPEKGAINNHTAKDSRRLGLDATAFDKPVATSDDGSFRTANTHLVSSRATTTKQYYSDSFGTAPVFSKASRSIETEVGDGFKQASNKGLVESTGSTVNRPPSPQKRYGKQTPEQTGGDDGIELVDVEGETDFQGIENLRTTVAPTESDATRIAREQADKETKERIKAEELRQEREAHKKAERRELENKLMTAILAGDSAATAAGAGGDGAEGEDGGQPGQAGSGLGRKRKRGVFGRAVSNNSIASSTSESVQAAAAAPPPPHPHLPGANSTATTTTGSHLGAGDSQEDSLMPDAPARPPPATQISYAEPDERKQLLRKMKGVDAGENSDDEDGSGGGDGGAGLAGGAGGTKGTLRRVESMTMGQYEKMKEEEIMANSGRRGRKRVPGF